MTADVDRSVEGETCRKLISLGYARSKQVRLYGQEMKLVSDPFCGEEGIEVDAVRAGEAKSRRIKLPLSILQIAAPKRAA